MLVPSLSSVLLVSVLSLFLDAAVAAPAAQSTRLHGRGNAEPPIITLPYGKWRARRYNANDDVYVFKNVRFAAPPVGPLRWAAPAPPEADDPSTIHDGSDGKACVQSFPSGTQKFALAWTTWLAPAEEKWIVSGEEDCLFLDVYVPGKAIRGEAKDLAVIVWISGGVYVFGSKHQANLYDASSLIEQSGGNVIMVTGNYRLGAYGFLAGPTVEDSGLPNAGLHDQRAVFKWVKQYISLLGGDSENVSAWGMSSGSGSIIHHLVAYGGTQDPLFNRALLISPAFQSLWDRHGTLESTYRDFAKLAGCENQGLECLRAADAETLKKANQDVQLPVPRTTYIFGPAADGKFLRQLAGMEFASGNYWKGLDSLVISHVPDEVAGFADESFNEASKFSSHLDVLFPPYVHDTGLADIIKKQYPSADTPDSKYSSPMERAKAMINDFAFAYHGRSLTEAYKGKTYNIQYSVPPGVHAIDLLALFYRHDLDLNIFGWKFTISVPVFSAHAKAYQSYLTSHARTGDPNTYAQGSGKFAPVHWPHPEVGEGEHYGNVLNADLDGFSLITDTQNSRASFQFWDQMAAAVTSFGGYAPPGAAVEQSLMPFYGLASARFEQGPAIA